MSLDKLFKRGQYATDAVPTEALAFILNTYREHVRDSLSAKTIQNRMDTRFDKSLHPAIWTKLLELIND